MTKSRAIIISLLIGAVSVFFISSYINGKEELLLRLSTPIEVIVAARDIPEGARLQDDMLETILIPKKFIQPDTVKNIDEIRDRVVTVPLLRGTQILGSMLALNQDIGLSQKIPKDKSGMAISVDDASAIAGLIQPGDFVDVSVTVEVEAERDSQSHDNENLLQLRETEMLTKLVLTKVMVLAVDQRSHRSRSGNLFGNANASVGSRFIQSTSTSASTSRQNIATVTLALDKEQVLPLTLAQKIGSISLALHSSWNDEEQSAEAESKEIGSFELLGIRRAIVRDSVDVYYGAKRRRNN